ncbi:hypothetical protein V6N13_123745 [Hibiscus sabdariffa]
MRSLCSVFDVKKQGKPVWEVRTRYWKLREGENRLSVLLEGIPITSLMEARRQEDQGLNHLFNSILCISGLEYRNQHGGIGTRFLFGIRVSVLPYGYRYGSRVVSVLIHWYRLSCGMARPRRGVRGGGQAPVHLDEVEMEPENEETLPPPPPVGGEANEGGAGPQAGVGPQAGQGPAVGDMTPLIQAIAGAFQTAMAGVQGAAQPQGVTSGEIGGMVGEHYPHTRADGVYRYP